MLKLFFLITLVCGKKYRSYDGNKTYPHGFTLINNTNTRFTNVRTVNTPPRFDWRDTIDVDIRNRETCGSCWAFATVSPIEYLYTYTTNKKVHISEQELISCNSHEYSCRKGGYWDFDDLINNGIYLNDDYPYDSIDEPCKNVSRFNNINVITWGYTGDTIEQIKSGIFQYGPVVSGISVDKEFYNYLDGIYDHDSNEHINHAVVLVGWDDSLNSWILRNSWSTSWGSNGYMYIEYGVSGVGTDVAYVTIETKKNKEVNK